MQSRHGVSSRRSAYPWRERFPTELTLDPPDATSDQAGVPLLDEDYLILSTIHSAKGQEWKSVYLLNVVDGCMPSDLGAGRRRYPCDGRSKPNSRDRFLDKVDIAEQMTRSGTACDCPKFSGGLYKINDACSRK